MREETAGRPSQTAEVMALFRALESTRPAHDRLFTDPLAKQFLRPWGRLLVAAARIPAVHRRITASIDRRWPGARTSALARTRLIDDVVSAGVREGATQLLLLGAGFDCRAHRLAGLEDVRVFEVDQAATQDVKRSLVARRVPQSSARVRYIPLNFRRELLSSVLRTNGFDPSARSVVIWEGVTNYLSASSVDATLRDVVASVGPTSQILFTYVHAGLLDGSVNFERGAEILERVSAVGEPWTFGLDPKDLAAYLAARGMSLIEDVSADEYRARQFGAAAKQMTGYSFYRVVHALVTAPQAGNFRMADGVLRG